MNVVTRRPHTCRVCTGYANGTIVSSPDYGPSLREELDHVLAVREDLEQEVRELRAENERVTSRLRLALRRLALLRRRPTV